MALDFFVNWMLGPTAFLLVIAAIGIPFLFWRLILGKAYAGIGPKPLAIGYALSLVGLLVASFIGSYQSFYDHHVANGYLPASDFWKVVPGWSIYLFLLTIILALIILGVLAVPIAAVLLRKGWFNFLSIVLCLSTFWIISTITVCLEPTNQWEKEHRLEWLLKTWGDLFPWVVCVGGAFFSGVYLPIKNRKQSPEA